MWTAVTEFLQCLTLLVRQQEGHLAFKTPALVIPKGRLLKQVEENQWAAI